MERKRPEGIRKNPKKQRNFGLKEALLVAMGGLAGAAIGAKVHDWEQGHNNRAATVEKEERTKHVDQLRDRYRELKRLEQNVLDDIQHDRGGALVRSKLEEDLVDTRRAQEEVSRELETLGELFPNVISPLAEQRKVPAPLPLEELAKKSIGGLSMYEGQRKQDLTYVKMRILKLQSDIAVIERGFGEASSNFVRREGKDVSAWEEELAELVVLQPQIERELGFIAQFSHQQLSRNKAPAPASKMARNHKR